MAKSSSVGLCANPRERSGAPRAKDNRMLSPRADTAEGTNEATPGPQETLGKPNLFFKIVVFLKNRCF